MFEIKNTSEFCISEIHNEKPLFVNEVDHLEHDFFLDYVFSS